MYRQSVNIAPRPQGQPTAHDPRFVDLLTTTLRATAAAAVAAGVLTTTERHLHRRLSFLLGERYQ